MQDIYRQVTERIIQQLVDGTPPWRQPWDSRACGMPRNGVTKKPYSGLNVLLLWDEANQCSYSSNLWATYRQWQAIGGQVLRGSRATKIIYWKTWDETVTDLDTGTERNEKRFVLREYNVFAFEQVDGDAIQCLHQAPERNKDFIDFQPAEDLIAATGAKIIHCGNRAFYNVESDRIYMPLKQAFETPQDYFGTALHELIHLSGHPARLNRLDKLSRFGDHTYAMEELVAEMGAAFLMAHLGIPNNDVQNQASYLDSWLDVFQKDASAIITASTQASRAADYILSFSQEDKNGHTAQRPVSIF